MINSIKIKAVLNGYNVKIGSQKLAYTSREKLLRDLGDYFQDPETTKKRILEQEAINKEHFCAKREAGGFLGLLHTAIERAAKQQEAAAQSTIGGKPTPEMPTPDVTASPDGPLPQNPTLPQVPMPTSQLASKVASLN